MQHYTEYPGPDRADYANVFALNAAFLRATSDLKGPQRGRLAASPFLLFSLREDDLQWWERILADDHQADLVSEFAASDFELRRIQTVAISYLWQLARQNAYAARVVSGASIAWCEKIAELPLITLLDRSAGRSDLMKSRLDTSDTLGGRLLGDGISASRDLRRSSQFSALQGLLTRSGLDESARLPAAACTLSGPMRVSDKKV